MPSFQVRAYRALPLTSLINSDRRIADNFQEWDDALASPIGPLDVSVGRSNVGPIVAQSAGPFGEFGVVGNDLEDVVEIV